MTVTVLNANHPQYWIDVKRRAAIRKACKIVEEQLWLLETPTTPTKNISARSIASCILNSAAKSVGINDDAGFAEMKAHCVKEYDLPREILNSTEAEFEANAAEAAEAVERAIDYEDMMAGVVW